MSKDSTSLFYMDQYKKFQLFTSVQEFDRNRSKVFYTIKSKLSKGAVAVWNVLAHHSCKVPGVCWIKIDTISKLADVSRSTVERAIRLFKKLGVLKVEETIRPEKGGDGANVYVFQKLGEGAQSEGAQNHPDTASGQASKPKKQKENRNSFKTKSLKDSKVRTADADRKPNWVPVEFFNLLKYHMESSEIEEYWRAAYAVTYNLELSSVEKTKLAMDAFMTLKSKRKNLEKPIAFFVGVIKKKSRAIHVKNLFLNIIG